MCYTAAMEKTDGRKIDRKSREAIRKLAIQRIQAGESPEHVIKVLGFHRSSVYIWMQRYQQGGFDGLKTLPLSGRPPKLTKAQEKKVFDIVTLKNPMQLKFPFALWTRAMVRELIRDQFGVEMSEVNVGRLLHKLGLTPQRPLRRAYQQNEVRVQRWLEEEYPAIKAAAKKEKATIYFGDEAGVRSDYHSGTTWAPKGQTPVIRTSGSRHSLNMISAISAKGAMRFMTVKGRVNADRFIEFLERLIKNAPTPVYLIVDGHPVHRSTQVRTYVESTEGKLKLFYLPPYSPELNPDEQVWNHVKNHKIGKKVIKSQEDLESIISSTLKSLQKSYWLIMSFFRHKECAYTIA
jgi:transposase